MLLPQLGHAFEFVMPKAYHTTDAEGLYCAAQQIWLLNVRSGSQTAAPVTGYRDRFSPDSCRQRA